MFNQRLFCSSNPNTSYKKKKKKINDSIIHDICTSSFFRFKWNFIPVWTLTRCCFSFLNLFLIACIPCVVDKIIIICMIVLGFCSFWSFFSPFMFRFFFSTFCFCFFLLYIIKLLSLNYIFVRKNQHYISFHVGWVLSRELVLCQEAKFQFHK